MSQGSEPLVLKAEVRDVRSMAMMLRAIAFTPLCQVTVSPMGLQMITEVNGVLQATAYLSSNLFVNYLYKAPQADIDAARDCESEVPTTLFEVSLSDLLVCLNIYGNAGNSVPGKAKERDEELASRRREMTRSSTVAGKVPVQTELFLSYKGEGGPLILELKEGKTTTRCELSTFIANAALITDMPFLSDRVAGQVIMASKDLMEALQSIDSTVKEVTISFLNASKRRGKRRAPASTRESTTRASSSIALSTADGIDRLTDENLEGEEKGDGIQMMRIRADGDTGSTELEMPNQHNIFELFTCSRNCSNDYRWADLQRCLKALQTSIKTSVRMDDEGMLDLQFLFPRRMDQVSESYANGGASSRSDAEDQGFVELKLIPIFVEDE